MIIKTPFLNYKLLLLLLQPLLYVPGITSLVDEDTTIYRGRQLNLVKYIFLFVFGICDLCDLCGCGVVDDFFTLSIKCLSNFLNHHLFFLERKKHWKKIFSQICINTPINEESTCFFHYNFFQNFPLDDLTTTCSKKLKQKM